VFTHLYISFQFPHKVIPSGVLCLKKETTSQTVNRAWNKSKAIMPPKAVDCFGSVVYNAANQNPEKQKKTTFFQGRLIKILKFGVNLG